MVRRYRGKSSSKRSLLEYRANRGKVRDMEYSYIHGRAADSGAVGASGAGNPTAQKGVAMAEDAELQRLRREVAAVEELKEWLGDSSAGSWRAMLDMVYLNRAKLSVEGAAARLMISREEAYQINRMILTKLQEIREEMGLE